MLTIDGSRGEGGGQILRTSLALSLVTGTPFRIESIRGRRRRPGLMRQHLTAVQAAARIGSAEVEGAAQGSRQLTFRPRRVVPGDYAFDVGTAGSTTLVLQTVLPALMTAEGPSILRLEGGTHNPAAPPFEFLSKSFLPLLGRMGVRVTALLERHGFYPAGGGRLRVTVDPARELAALDLVERGTVKGCRVKASVARLPESIAERELRTVGSVLGSKDATFEQAVVAESKGPGNVVSIEIESQALTEVFTGFGMRGVRAETVAGKVAAEAVDYLDSGVPVGRHLADQLMLPLALAGSGRYLTMKPTGHAATNALVIREFLDVDLMPRKAGGVWEIAR